MNERLDRVTTDNNLQEYFDPVMYDAETSRMGAPDTFYLTLAKRIGGAVLELGCGTGRYTLPIAQEGISITGLDAVPQMLDHAKSKSAGLEIEWVEADARDFHLGRQFRLIYESGGMFSHLLKREDCEAALRCIRDHLEPGGFFVLSSVFIRPPYMETVETEHDWFSYTLPHGVVVRVSGFQHYDALNQITTETAIRRWVDANGQPHEHISPLKLHHYHPQELAMLLHYNGFEIVESYGDSDFSPLTDESPYIYYVCQVR